MICASANMLAQRYKMDIISLVSTELAKTPEKGASGAPGRVETTNALRGRRAK